MLRKLKNKQNKKNQAKRIRYGSVEVSCGGEVKYFSGLNSDAMRFAAKIAGFIKDEDVTALEGVCKNPTLKPEPEHIRINTEIKVDLETKKFEIKVRDFDDIPAFKAKLVADEFVILNRFETFPEVYTAFLTFANFRVGYFASDSPETVAEINRLNRPRDAIKKVYPRVLIDGYELRDEYESFPVDETSDFEDPDTEPNPHSDDYQERVDFADRISSIPLEKEVGIARKRTVPEIIKYYGNSSISDLNYEKKQAEIMVNEMNTDLEEAEEYLDEAKGFPNQVIEKTDKRTHINEARIWVRIRYEEEKAMAMEGKSYHRNTLYELNVAIEENKKDLADRQAKNAAKNKAKKGAEEAKKAIEEKTLKDALDLQKRTREAREAREARGEAPIEEKEAGFDIQRTELMRELKISVDNFPDGDEDEDEKKWINNELGEYQNKYNRMARKNQDAAEKVLLKNLRGLIRRLQVAPTEELGFDVQKRVLTRELQFTRENFVGDETPFKRINDEVAAYEGKYNRTVIKDQDAAEKGWLKSTRALIKRLEDAR